MLWHPDWWGSFHWFLFPILMLVAMMVIMGILLIVFRAVAWPLAASAESRTYERPPGLDEPQDILGRRLAKGEITGQQYQEALVDLLKERYVRDELDADEFERRLRAVLAEPQSARVSGRA